MIFGPVGTMLRKKLAQSAVAQQPYAPVSVRTSMRLGV